MKSFLKFFGFLMVCAFFLTGCLSPVKLKPQKQYILTSIPKQSSIKKPLPYTLMVMMPSGLPVFNTTQMAYTERPYEISYFINNRWSETPTQMLHPLLIQSLQNTNHFNAVIGPPCIGQYDYVLTTDVLRIIQDYTYCPAKMRIAIRAQLIETLTNKVIATNLYEVTEIIHHRSPYSGVIAANRATKNLLRKINRFCERNIHKKKQSKQR